LKETYGDKICFWGGGTDTQRVLPFGTPDEVRKYTRQQVEIFKKGGGYVFTSIHNIQPNTPVENIVAMIEAFREVR
jgi:uroporphyrinogen-III decarboxylase